MNRAGATYSLSTYLLNHKFDIFLRISLVK